MADPVADTIRECDRVTWLDGLITQRTIPITYRASRI